MCRVREAGVKCPSVGLGSTPTASQLSPLMKDVTELHPGNYVFYGETLYYCHVVGLCAWDALDLAGFVNLDLARA